MFWTPVFVTSLFNCHVQHGLYLGWLHLLHIATTYPLPPLVLLQETHGCCIYCGNYRVGGGGVIQPNQLYAGEEQSVLCHGVTQGLSVWR